MQVERGDVPCVAVFVGGEGVDCVGVAVWDGLGGLEGGVGDEGCVVGEWGFEVGWSTMLEGLVS